MKAREIMTENPDVVTPEDRLQEAAQLMRDRNIGIVPVVADRGEMRLTGLVTDRDITVRHVAEGHDSSDCKVQEAMSGDDIHSVSPDDDSNQVMQLMRRHQIRRVPVIENDRLVGIIAQADIAVEAGQQGQDEEVGDTVEAISEPAKPAR